MWELLPRSKVIGKCECLHTLPMCVKIDLAFAFKHEELPDRNTKTEKDCHEL